ncbi:nitrate reductase-like protein [Fusarium oxysporum f. sp. melonis 26406]|uniref:Nitrate reductase-like protein n=1 Tax=Fusarium oxysporum f. sp. melonis 26406 TaxID=1089452 RepID=W9ZZ64_FUSOX|nr:nitrate reductase-like protein [Fusarium oxysporum f. sp. melonis 26406]
MDTCSEAPSICSRDSIEDIWGPRTPYVHQWPTRVDHACDEEPEKWVQSACVLCSNGCGLDIGVKDGKVVGVRGRATDRVNKGRLGPKGLNGWKAIHSKERLTHPLIRRNGKLERATWDEAMDLIVKKSKQLVEKLTAHSIAFYTSGQLFLEEYYVLALIGKAGLNTLHMDGNTRLCTATAAASMRESFGSDGQPGSYTDIDYTDCLFMVGHNMAATQTVLWSRVLDRLAGPTPPKLIVVDPRYSESASKATLHLAPKIGTNLALLNGIQHLMFKNGWINEAYVSKHVVGLEALRSTVEGYNPERVAEITGVPASKIEEAASILGQTPSLLSSALQGVYQSNQATASACQINNIHLLRGLIGKAGSGIFQMNGQPTAQNNRETGCDGEFPGFRNHQNAKHMQELADLWNINNIKVPHWNEPTHIHNMLTFMEKGSIRMVWVSGTNPLVSLPNLPKVRDVFTQPELFVICQDIYMTETASIADVVLPAAQWGEKTGCFTNVDRTVHLSHKAVEPPGEAKPDLEIFLDYSRRMEFKNKEDEPLTPWTEPEEVFEAWKRLSAGRPCDYTGMSYAKLTGGSGIQWPCNDQYPVGKERLFDDGVFFTDIDYCESYGHDLQTGVPYSEEYYKELRPAGRAILKTCDYIPPYEDPDHEYPLRLSTGRNVYHFHTRTKTGRTALQKACPEPEIRISEKDAETYDVKTGDMVVIKSRRGEVEMKVKVGKISQGQAFIPFHFGYWDTKDGRARAANELTITEWDPISKQPTFKSGAISIEKVPDDRPTAKERQSEALAKAEQNDASNSNVTESDLNNRERELETWLGETYESILLLRDITEQLLDHLVADSEAHSGVRILIQITKDTTKRLKPQVDKFGENQARGRHAAHTLRDSLFPKSDDTPSQLQVLEALRSLQVYLAHLRVGLEALNPVSQAIWDKEFFQAVLYAISQVKRMQDWVTTQIKVRAPQALLVPCKVD